MSIYCSLLCFKNHVIERQQLAIQTIFYIDRRFFWNLSPVTDSDVTLVCLHFAHSCTLPFVFKIQKRGYLVMPREKHASVDIPVSLNFLPTRSGWPHAPLWIPSIATHKHTLYHFVPFVSYIFALYCSLSIPGPVVYTRLSGRLYVSVFLLSCFQWSVSPSLIFLPSLKSVSQCPLMPIPWCLPEIHDKFYLATTSMP